jgi:hypothetical protein
MAEALQREIEELAAKGDGGKAGGGGMAVVETVGSSWVGMHLGPCLRRPGRGYGQGCKGTTGVSVPPGCGLVPSDCCERILQEVLDGKLRSRWVLLSLGGSQDRGPYPCDAVRCFGWLLPGSSSRWCPWT